MKQELLPHFLVTGGSLFPVPTPEFLLYLYPVIIDNENKIISYLSAPDHCRYLSVNQLFREKLSLFLLINSLINDYRITIMMTKTAMMTKTEYRTLNAG